MLSQKIQIGSLLPARTDAKPRKAGGGSPNPETRWKEHPGQFCKRRFFEKHFGVYQNQVHWLKPARVDASPGRGEERKLDPVSEILTQRCTG